MAAGNCFWRDVPETAVGPDWRAGKWGLRWFAKYPRDWCDAKCVEVLERNETTKYEIGVLNAVQCRKLLETAMRSITRNAFQVSQFPFHRYAESGVDSLAGERHHNTLYQPAGQSAHGRIVLRNAGLTFSARFGAMPSAANIILGKTDPKAMLMHHEYAGEIILPTDSRVPIELSFISAFPFSACQ